MGQICAKKKKSFKPSKKFADEKVIENVNKENYVKTEERITSLVNENVAEDIKEAINSSEHVDVVTAEEASNDKSNDDQNVDENNTKDSGGTVDRKIEDDLLLKEVLMKNLKKGDHTDQPPRDISEEFSNKNFELTSTPRNSIETSTLINSEVFDKTEETKVDTTESAETEKEKMKNGSATAAEGQASFEDFSNKVFQTLKDSYGIEVEDGTEDESITSTVPSIVLTRPSVSVSDEADFEEFSAQVFQGIREKLDDGDDSDDTDDGVNERKTEIEDEKDDTVDISGTNKATNGEPCQDETKIASMPSEADNKNSEVFGSDIENVVEKPFHLD